eukprot:283096-Amphidinium_carterae.1
METVLSEEISASGTIVLICIAILSEVPPLRYVESELFLLYAPTPVPAPLFGEVARERVLRI